MVREGLLLQSLRTTKDGIHSGRDDKVIEETFREGFDEC